MNKWTSVIIPLVLTLALSLVAVLVSMPAIAAGPFEGVSGSDITSDADGTESVAVGDVNGDGHWDVVAGNIYGGLGEINRLYLNSGNTTDPFYGVSGSDITSDTGSTESVALGDMDGDGDLDLVAGNLGGGGAQLNRLYLNSGNTSNPFYGVNGSNISSDPYVTRSVALGDMDGDGDLDVVAGNSNGDPSRLYLNDGNGSFTGSNISDDTYDTTAVEVGDINGDGHLDVVVGNTDSQINRLYLNDGTGTFTGFNITSDGNNTNSMALGDMDGDGDLDVVAGNSWRDRLYLNSGNASDPFYGVTGSDITSDGFDTSSVALGDVDGDGDLDVVTVGLNWANRLYVNDGNGSFTGSNVSDDRYYSYSVAVGDMNGDGYLDVVVGNGGGVTPQVNRLYLNNGWPGDVKHDGRINACDITMEELCILDPVGYPKENYPGWDANENGQGPNAGDLLAIVQRMLGTYQP